MTGILFLAVLVRGNYSPVFTFRHHRCSLLASCFGGWRQCLIVATLLTNTYLVDYSLPRIQAGAGHRCRCRNCERSGSSSSFDDRWRSSTDLKLSADGIIWPGKLQGGGSERIGVRNGRTRWVNHFDGPVFM